jgi:hypothetical protein
VPQAVGDLAASTNTWQCQRLKSFGILVHLPIIARTENIGATLASKNSSFLLSNMSISCLVI